MKFTKYGREWELPSTFYRVSVKLVIFDDQNRLLVLLDGKTNAWELPGGGLEHGESVEDAMRREIQEELGVKLTHIDPTPFFVQTGVHPDNYWAFKPYYRASIDSTDFTLEGKFTSDFVDEATLKTLYMLGDESAVQQNTELLWSKRA